MCFDSFTSCFVLFSNCFIYSRKATKWLQLVELRLRLVATTTPSNARQEYRLEVGAWTKIWASSYYNYHSCICWPQLMRWPDAGQCCVCLLCGCTLCLGQWGATCPPQSVPGLVSSHELLWGLTACLPWTPFLWRFCMVWRWLPVDVRLYWISSAATKAETKKKKKGWDKDRKWAK